MNDLGDGPVWGAIGAAVAGLFAWFASLGRTKVDSKKVDVDESGALFGGWKSLFEEVRAEATALRERVEHLEKLVGDMQERYSNAIAKIKSEHQEELRRHLDEINALRRHIAQNAQSTLHMMGDMGSSIDKDVAAAVGEATKTLRQEIFDGDEPTDDSR